MNTAAAHGAHTTHGVPTGYTSLTPFVVVSPARDAIDFYTSVFGAKLLDCTDGPDGTVMHASMDFGTGILQLSDPSPGFGLVDDPFVVDDDRDSHSISFYCPNVDEIVEAARTAGATIREEVSTFVSGDRFASIRDPFGQRWAVLTRVEDLSPEESEARVAEWAESMTQQ